MIVVKEFTEYISCIFREMMLAHPLLFLHPNRNIFTPNARSTEVVTTWASIYAAASSTLLLEFNKTFSWCPIPIAGEEHVFITVTIDVVIEEDLANYIPIIPYLSWSIKLMCEYCRNS